MRALFTAVAFFVATVPVVATEIEQVVPQGDNVVLNDVIVCSDLTVAIQFVVVMDKDGPSAGYDLMGPGIPCTRYQTFGFVAGKLEYEGKTLRIVETMLLIRCNETGNTTPPSLDPEFILPPQQLFVVISLPYRAGSVENPVDPCPEDSM